jgi:glycine oxidase
MSPAGEVLIAGGGLIGSSIAWRLAQQGINVVVADAGDLGGEASPAGAGMLSPGAEAEHASAWLDLGVESLRLYGSFVEELRGETGLAIDYRRVGCLVMDQQGRAARARLHASAGIRVEERADGLFYPDDALVDPLRLLKALRCAAEARGARFEKRRLSALDADQHAAVVVAAGAWSGALEVACGGQRVALPATVPVKGHLIGFAMPPGTVGPFLRRGTAYVLQRADGLVVAGSNEERVGFDTAIDDRVCRKLHEDAAALLPAIEGKRPARRWIGFRPALAEGSGPRMERVKGTNVWLAYGHYRNGILLTPVTATRVSAEVVSGLRGA